MSVIISIFEECGLIKNIRLRILNFYDWFPNFKTAPTAKLNRGDHTSIKRVISIESMTLTKVIIFVINHCLLVLVPRFLTYGRYNVLTKALLGHLRCNFCV